MRDLASLFHGRHRQVEWKIAKNTLARGRQLCTQLSIFEGSLQSCFAFLIVSTSKNEEVSQNCFVFDAKKSKVKEVLQNCCVFLMLSRSKIEEVSQNASFNLADR